MKNIRVGLAFLIVSILMGCGSAPKKQEFTKGGIFVRTPETEHLLANLKKV